jgi:GNAT superfamily N-acetyltransferase
MSFTVDEIDLRALSDADLGGIVDLYNAAWREVSSRSVDLDVDEFRLFMSGPGRVRHRYAAFSRGGNTVGVGQASFADDGSNPDVLRCEIQVDVAHRRSGIGTAVLSRIVELAENLGRNRLHGWHHDTVPAGAAFAAAIGATEGLEYHLNMVRIADLDLQQLAAWSDEGPRRAPDYTVELIEGAWPEAMLEDIAHLYYVLERDMPMTEGIEPREWSAELVASMQEHYQRGTRSISAVATHDGSGRAVGLTQLLRRNNDPTTWIVTTTMVDPEHRGNGLGKWLKAAANLAALERWPDGVYQETGNAFTNEAMLAINRQMGFEHELTTTDVEIQVEDARKYLEARG